MARIRTLKPEFWTDGKIVSLPPAARLLFIGTWNFTRCDHGHLDDDAVALKLRVLPADDVDPHATLDLLIQAGLIDRYEADGRTFLHIRRFNDHQKVETRWNNRCPYCPLQDLAKPRQNSREFVETPPTSPQEGKGREGKGNKEPSSPQGDDALEKFEIFWKTYPERNGKRIGKAKALAIWKRLSPEDRLAAYLGAKHYAAACVADLTIAADAMRWLRDKRWEDWQTPATPSRPRTPLEQGRGPMKPFRPTTPGCEHSPEMCKECRRENLRKVKELQIGKAVS